MGTAAKRARGEALAMRHVVCDFGIAQDSSKQAAQAMAQPRTASHPGRNHPPLGGARTCAVCASQQAAASGRQRQAEVMDDRLAEGEGEVEAAHHHGVLLLAGHYGGHGRQRGGIARGHGETLLDAGPDGRPGGRWQAGKC